MTYQIGTKYRGQNWQYVKVPKNIILLMIENLISNKEVENISIKITNNEKETEKNERNGSINN